MCGDKVVRRCVPMDEVNSILQHCHYKEVGGHFGPNRTEGEKNHKKGGLNCVFGNFFFYVLDNCPQVQSLK